MCASGQSVLHCTTLTFVKPNSHSTISAPHLAGPRAPHLIWRSGAAPFSEQVDLLKTERNWHPTQASNKTSCR